MGRSRARSRRRIGGLVAAVCLALAAGCSGSSAPATSPGAGTETLPNLAGFLALPVAQPSHCAKGSNSTTVGRPSPWVGHVDVSVFLETSATTTQVLRLGNTLRTDSLVTHVYFESQQQAHEEFARLYTCSNLVPRSETPPSYRVVLDPTTTIAARDTLVANLAVRSYVDSVSCDPTIPCTNIVRSPSAAP